MKTFEVNFDGLVGPTHNYAGLSFGNIASIAHRAATSRPREAALQGLRKMKALADLGLKQALLPPQERPFIPALRALGFTGDDAAVFEKAARDTPEIFRAVCSASSMWTANAATVAPSVDTPDRKVHFTPANLTAKFHRSIEPESTSHALKTIFFDPDHFMHHSWLPGHPSFGDEGAANHTRLCRDHGSKGLHVFVFGRRAFGEGPAPVKFPARQTLEASMAVARLHDLSVEQTAFIQQSPDLIDAGVFHNDVASVGNEKLLFYLEKAFLGGPKALEELTRKLQALGSPLQLLCVPAEAVSVEDAVKSYLFNSQLITLPNGKVLLVAPEDCRQNEKVKRYLDNTIGKSPIDEVQFFDLRQSMSNGGGPACLRLRVVLTEKEWAAVHEGVKLTPALYDSLTGWVQKHYREEISPIDLMDPAFLQETRDALDELTSILKLGTFYPFQRYSS